MKLTSSAFEDNNTIPAKYTCEGEAISPPLSWEGVPDEAECLALIVEDPDAPRGTFTHWVIYNIPVSQHLLEEGASLDERFSAGLREGFNDFGNQGYGSPCPPRGNPPHHYRFRLFALDQYLSITGRVTRAQLLDEMKGKIMEETVLVGQYGRK